MEDKKDIMTDIRDAAEEVGESVNEAAENAAEAADNTVSDAAEKAESVIENAAENITEASAGAADAMDDASGTSADAVGDHVSESEIEIKENIEDEIKEAYDPTKLKGTAPNSSPLPVKKGRKPLNKTNIIVIVVCAVIVVACLIFVGFKVGWFDFLKKTGGDLKLADTSRIEVYKDEVEVDDSTIEYYIDSILSSMATTETLEEGTVEDGDTVDINYVGKLKETGEEFEGGSAEGYDLTIGSGSFIDGFEDGLIGKKSGEEVSLNLTFPEDYSNEELAGKDVIFDVKINHIDRTITPELTDEWVKDYSSKYCEKTYNTVDEFREYAKQTVTDYYLNNGIYSYLNDNSEVIAYDAEKEKELMEYSDQSLQYYAQQYGMDADSYAAMYGANNAEEYNRNQADEYLKIAMITDAVCKKNNITYTDEELNAAIEQYMKDQRYIDQYTVDEFIKQSGDTWIWLFTNLEFRYDKAMQSLKDNVVVLEERPTTAEDAEGEDAVDVEEIGGDVDIENVDGDVEDIEVEEEESVEAATENAETTSQN